MSATIPPKIKAIIVLAFTLLIAGCSPRISPEQPVHSDAYHLTRDVTIGQTFVSRYEGLTGIELYLESAENANGSLNLRLSPNPGEQIRIAEASLALTSVSTPGYYRFTFPEIPSSNQRYYFFELDIIGDGRVKIGRAPGEAYWQGAAYRNGEPQDRQLAFKLVYDPVQAVRGLLQEIVVWTGYLFSAAFLFVLPGWGVLALFFPPGHTKRWSSFSDINWPAKLAISTGISLAVYPVLLVITDFFGVHLGFWYAWIPPIFGLGVVLWRFSQRHPRGDVPPKASTRLFNFPQRDFWPDFTFIIVITLIFFTRFWMVRSLEGPMWGDSYQHAVITRLLVAHQGLFSSWEPYAPYQSLTIHFGFSVFAALFSWLTGLNATDATLWMGQILNGLAVLTLYPLAWILSHKNRWAGVSSLVVAGLLTPVPAIYVNWGRYAQLAGQAILPIAVWLTWDLLESKGGRLRIAVLTGLAVAGMTLSYYRMPFYYSAFTLVLLIGQTIKSRDQLARFLKVSLPYIFLSAALAMILFLPWGTRLLGSNLASALEVGVANTTPLADILLDLRAWSELSAYLPVYLTTLTTLALVWSLFRRRWEVLMLPSWIAILVVYKIGSLYQLPGANMLQNFAIIIALYIPVGLMVGWLSGDLLALVARQFSNTRRVEIALAIGLIFISGLAAWKQRSLVSPKTYALITRPDRLAMEWIKTNTTTEELFLVQGFPIYNGASAVGADAGWWIPLLTGRENTMPPQYALLNELPVPEDYTRRIVQLTSFLIAHPLGSPESIEMICQTGVSHIYSGQRAGKIGAAARQLFAPRALTQIPSAFDLVYHQDNVYIFRVVAEACTTTK